MCLQQILKYHDFDVLSRNSIFVETFFNCSLRRWFSFNFSTRLVFFIFLPFKWVSRQKWACLEILMRKIVAIATDLSFSGRQVCSYQCPSISSLCAPDTIGNRYKTLYFPPNVPGKCSILWSIPKLISLLTVSKFLQYSKLSHWTLLMPKWVGVIYCPMNYKDLLGPRVIKDHLLKYNSNKSVENKSTATISFGIDIDFSNTTKESQTPLHRKN